MRLSAGLSHSARYAFFIAGAVCVAAAAGYLMPKMLDTSDGLDFRLIWLAGRLWTKGISPYSDEFAPDYLATFGPGPNTHFWVYPPYWIALSGPFSWMPFRTALLVWNALNVFLLGFTAWLTAERIVRSPVQRWAVFFAIFAFGALLQATPFALALGQTSFLVAAGAAAFIKGYVERRNVWLAAGLVLLMLKPHVGIAVLFLAALRRSNWSAIAAAAAACAGFALIAALSAGFEETIGGFLQALRLYRADQFSATRPENLTGLVHLWSLVSNWSPPTGALSVLAGAAGAAATAFVKDDDERCLILFGAILAFVPMHVYDFTLVLVLLPLLAGRSLWGLGAAALGCLLLFRCSNAALALGWMHPESSADFSGSLLASIAAFLLFLAALKAIGWKLQTTASG